MLKEKIIEFLYECLLIIGGYYGIKYMHNLKNPDLTLYVVFGGILTVIFFFYAVIKLFKAITEAIKNRK